jgi:hypothetical protein
MVQFLVFVAFGLCVAHGAPANAGDAVKPPAAVTDARYRGAWTRDRRYRRDDLVVFLRALWRCRVDRCTAGKAPDYPEWEVAGPGVGG